MRRLAERMERGELEVEMRVEQREFVHELERIVRSVKVSSLAAASILSMGLLTLAYRPPGLERWARWVFVGGFVATAGLVAWLALDSWRQRRR